MSSVIIHVRISRTRKRKAFLDNFGTNLLRIAKFSRKIKNWKKINILNNQKFKETRISYLTVQMVKADIF